MPPPCNDATLLANAASTSTDYYSSVDYKGRNSSSSSSARAKSFVLPITPCTLYKKGGRGKAQERSLHSSPPLCQE